MLDMAVPISKAKVLKTPFALQKTQLLVVS